MVNATATVTPSQPPCIVAGMAVESVAKVCVFISGPIAIFICVFGFYSWAVLCVFVGIWMVMQVRLRVCLRLYLRSLADINGMPVV